MAMEVTSTSKRLHKHVVPVALLLVGLITLSVIGMTSYSSQGQSTEPLIVRALFTRVLDVKQSSHGLASVKLHQVTPVGSDGISNAGAGASNELRQLGTPAVR